MNSTLHISNLSVGFKRKIIIKNAEFKIHSGEMVAIKGRNGTGKTTLIRTLAGLSEPLAGDVFIDEKSIVNMSPKKRAHLLCSVMTRQASPPALSVLSTVSMGRYSHASSFGWISDADMDLAKNSLAKLGILHLSDQALFTLSDGELQKVMLAKALTQKSKFIILDEPTSYLDYVAKDEVLKTMAEIASVEHTGILFSSHDLELIERYAHRILEVQDGSICEITKK